MVNIDSVSDEECGRCIATCCCKFIFGLGFGALILWLLLRYSSPKCYIRTLYLPSLNATLNLTNPDPTFNLTLRLVNPNKLTSIQYDALEVTVYDFPNRSHVLNFGNVMVPNFDQGRGEKATKSFVGVANTTIALAAISKNGTGVFRVDLATKVKFKLMTIFETKDKFDIKVGANVVVNASGVKVDPKDIRLIKSMAPKIRSFLVLVVGSMMNFFVFTLFNF